MQHLEEPYRTLAQVSVCCGLRISEALALRWSDVNRKDGRLQIERGIVAGNVDDVKTEYSRDIVPLAPELAAELLAYRERSYPTKEGWLFANPKTGRPYHQEEIQKKHIRPAGEAAGITIKVGWKTFRH